MLELGLRTLIAYLLGSLMGALLIGMARGVDIRDLGSGNAGGTNALRTQGLWFAAGVVVVDVGKGWLAAGWLPGAALPGLAADPAVDREWLTVACAAGAVLGHVWPVFHEFRGGKGGATWLGALLALAPALVPVALGAWLAVVVLAGFVSVATMTAGAAVAAALSLRDPEVTPLFCLALAMAAFLAWTHRSNLARLRARSEPRLEALWLLRPRKPS